MRALYLPFQYIHVAIGTAHLEILTPPRPTQTGQPSENAATYKTCGGAHKNRQMRRKP